MIATELVSIQPMSLPSGRWTMAPLEPHVSVTDVFGRTRISEQITKEEWQSQIHSQIHLKRIYAKIDQDLKQI